ncbi:MAG: hypothetical protein B655_1512 [Methanobacterium sp. Maddingley MBC34]|nr:MAG: hypothetical protein B655_1512 [Methanobacterium sp. Maddingley MBC34]
MKIIKTINKDSKNFNRAKHREEYDARRYKGRKKNVLLRKVLAHLFVNTIGIYNARYIGYNLVKIGILGAIISFVFLVILNGFGRFFLYYPYDFYVFAFFIVMGLIGGIIFILPSDYYKFSKCKQCNHEFAYKEDVKPDVREITTKNGPTTTFITRTYKCSYCGDLKKVHETIKREPISFTDQV